MCGPAALPLAAAGMAAAGQMMGGIAANAQGKYQGRIAEQNARLADEARQDSVIRGQREARQFYREVGQVKGQQIASMAANGIDVGAGSALRVQQDTAALVEEDAENLYSNIEQRSRGFEIEGMNSRAEGRAARHRGRQELIGSFFKSASTLAGGFSQARGVKARMGI